MYPVNFSFRSQAADMRLSPNLMRDGIHERTEKKHVLRVEAANKRQI
jgi:hypothetical protein